MVVCERVILTLVFQVEVDVPYTEYRDVQETVKSVMWPSDTVMDLVSRIVLQPSLPDL